MNMHINTSSITVVYLQPTLLQVKQPYAITNIGSIIKYRNIRVHW